MIRTHEKGFKYDVETMTKRGRVYFELAGDIVALACTKCKKVEAIEGFNKDKNLFAGISNICRECKKAKSAKHWKERKNRQPFQEVLESYETAQAHEVGFIWDTLKQTNKRRQYYTLKSEIIAVHCSGCDSFKIVTDVGKQKDSPIGVKNYCKQCQSKREKAKRAGEHVPVVAELRKKEIKKELECMRDAGEELTSKYNQTHNSALYGKTLNYFGGWREAIEQCLEIDYDTIRKDFESGQYYGRKLEEIVEEVLTSLGCNFKTQDSFVGENGEVLVPDFNLTGAPHKVAKELELTNKHVRVFIDSKLGKHTNEKSSSEEKYLPYCDKLIFVYARGIDYPEQLSEKVSRLPLTDLIILIEDKEQRQKLSDELIGLIWDADMKHLEEEADLAPAQ